MSMNRKGAKADVKTDNGDVSIDSDTNPIPAKPKRPMTAYHVYSQLERNYIIQNHPSYQPNTHEDNDHNNPNQESTSIDENASERPPKYRDIIMPKDWFLSRRGETKKKDRKNHGVISFVELSKTISYNWKNEADDETRAYCKRIADEQLARYHEEKAAYVEQYGEEAVKSKSRIPESTSKGSTQKRATKSKKNATQERNVSQHFVQSSVSPHAYCVKQHKISSSRIFRPRIQFPIDACTTSKFSLSTVSVPNSKSSFPSLCNSNITNHSAIGSASATNDHVMDSALNPVSISSRCRGRMDPGCTHIQGQVDIASNRFPPELFQHDTQFNPVQNNDSHSQNKDQNELLSPLDHGRPHPLDREVGAFLNRLLGNSHDGYDAGVDSSEDEGDNNNTNSNEECTSGSDNENSNLMLTSRFAYAYSSSNSSVISTSQVAQASSSSGHFQESRAHVQAPDPLVIDSFEKTSFFSEPHDEINNSSIGSERGSKIYSNRGEDK